MLVMARQKPKPMTKQQIRSLRIKLDLSRREFAERLGVSVDSIISWELGRSTPSRPSQTLLRLLSEGNIL